MPYVVTELTPRTRTVTLEDVLLDIVTDNMMRPVTNAEATGTRTYCYDKISEDNLRKLNIPAQIQALTLFYEKNKHLLDELENPSYNHRLQAELVKKYGRNGKEKIAAEAAGRGFVYSDIYNTFFVPKSRSKPGQVKWRQIDAPRQDLMDALGVFKTMLETMMGGCFYHTSAFAYIPKRRTVDLGIKHRNNRSNWFLKMDFSNFFGSTTLDFIMNMLSIIFPFSEIIRFPGGKQALENCLRFCMLDGGLPQGTPVSPLLTNIIMIPIDHKLSNALHHKKELSANGHEYGYVYTRYADDLFISNRVRFDYKAIEAYVSKVLRHFNAPFKINEDKTRYGSIAGANWMLGFMLNQEHEITVGHKRKKTLKATVANYMMDRNNGIRWSLEDVQVLNGELSYCRSIESDNIEALLDKWSEKFGNIREAIRTDLKGQFS